MQFHAQAEFLSYMTSMVREYLTYRSFQVSLAGTLSKAKLFQKAFLKAASSNRQLEDQGERNQEPSDRVQASIFFEASSYTELLHLRQSTGWAR